MPDDPPTRALPRPRVLLSALLVLGLLVAGAAGALLLRSLKKAPERQARSDEPALVGTVQVHRENFRETLTGYGRARALRRAWISAEVAGVVAWVAPKLEAGSPIAAGEELVRLDSEDHDRAVLQAEAQRRLDQSRHAAAETRRGYLAERVMSLQRELEISERDHQRTVDLFQQGQASESAVDAESQALERLRQRLLETQSLLAEAVETVGQRVEQVQHSTQAEAAAVADRERCTIHAPWAGAVVERSVRLSSRVAVGERLFEVLDPRRVEVPVSLAASALAQVSAGSPVVLRVRRGGEPRHEGVVARVGPAVSADESTFLAYVEVVSEEGPAAVAPGEFVYAEVRGAEYEDVVIVPRVAFVEDIVFVADPGDEGGALVTRSRRPEVIRWLPEVAVVRGGLAEGERVVVTNLEDVAEGTPVRLTADPDTDPSEEATTGS